MSILTKIKAIALSDEGRGWPEKERFEKIKLIAGLVVTAITVLGVIPALGGFANAFSGDGDGTLQYPYRVTTCEQLQNMHTGIGEHYVLMNDIDCTGSNNWNSGLGWTPVDFYGTLDGRNHSVSNITVNRSGISNVGFLGTLSGAVLNLNLTNVSIVGNTNVGGLAGITNNATITNVLVSGSVTGTFYTGGVVGMLSGDSLASKTKKVAAANGGDVETTPQTTNLISPIRIMLNDYSDFLYGSGKHLQLRVGQSLGNTG